MLEIDKLLQKELVIVNIGLKSFAESCELQGIQTYHVKWTPPGGGDPELIELLNKLL
jgi:hypothetical protein